MPVNPTASIRWRDAVGISPTGRHMVGYSRRVQEHRSQGWQDKPTAGGRDRQNWQNAIARHHNNILKSIYL